MASCQSFAPIVNEESKILLLGSMPGVRSLQQQEYYAHPQNRFWRLLALLLHEPEPCDYAAKKAMLLRNHIALWDTLSLCEREGSLDSDIKNEVPNAVIELLAEHPAINVVFCNGGKAAGAFKKYFAKRLPENVQTFYLHSTSPANARMNMQALAGEWQKILEYL